MTGLEGPFGALLLLGAAVVFWISAVNARDRARELARHFCKRQGWQLLDQTVALSSLRPIRTKEGLRWQRRYRFDFSPEGTGRRRGELTLTGGRMIRVWGELEDGGRLIEPE
ncbi:DUF3301 domain-containing protein [Wenzhouxiangella sediminis]|uniref:DUF3301 domain-containing protein n=1 Tax=Wenzhouxiangella sediminis TaxID=1792836 RepID=A0A3E1K5J2_9GAMM|nr:DUF3301 domain-containing protein [Wenzhouxiangella sediminis]RFF29303.1 DUF3301 domain-containing protein [Wenzhouxiangella sediminis]